MKTDSKYTIHQRVQALEARCTSLEAENKQLRTDLWTQVKNLIADSAGAEGKPGRDGASIVGPAGPAGRDSTVPGPEGRPGRDGRSIIGPQGIRGETGATPEISIGEIQTIDANQPARVWLTGTPEKPVLNFAIPRGAVGATGATGLQGLQGPPGDLTVISNDAEFQQLVKDARRKILEARARRAALINQHIADNDKMGIVGRHFARLLESIQRELDALQ